MKIATKICMIDDIMSITLQSSFNVATCEYYDVDTGVRGVEKVKRNNMYSDYIGVHKDTLYRITEKEWELAKIIEDVRIIKHFTPMVLLDKSKPKKEHIDLGYRTKFCGELFLAINDTDMSSLLNYIFNIKGYEGILYRLDDNVLTVLTEWRVFKITLNNVAKFVKLVML